MDTIKSVFTFTLSPVALISSGIGGAILSAIVSALGGWDPWLSCLCTVMAGDYITGFLCALRGRSSKTESGRVSSYASFWGIVKKGLILLIVFVAVQLGTAMEFEAVRNGIIIAFIINEGVSLIENLGLFGIGVPNEFKELFELLKNKKE